MLKHVISDSGFEENPLTDIGAGTVLGASPFRRIGAKVIALKYPKPQSMTEGR